MGMRISSEPFMEMLKERKISPRDPSESQVPWIGSQVYWGLGEQVQRQSLAGEALTVTEDDLPRLC